MFVNTTRKMQAIPNTGHTLENKGVMLTALLTVVIQVQSKLLES